MLPIGGKYTMDIEHAVKAAEWLQTTAVIPMHYNTFDAIQVDIDDFKRQVREVGKIPTVIDIGGVLQS
jgi:L-ascorbate metabolism protein UlaG (beta-lactamase superfamily)